MKALLKKIVLVVCFSYMATASASTDEELIHSEEMGDWRFTVTRSIEDNEYKVEPCTALKYQEGKVCVSWSPDTVKSKDPLGLWIYRDSNSIGNQAGKTLKCGFAVQIDENKPIPNDIGLMLIGRYDLMKFASYSWKEAPKLLDQMKNGTKMKILSSNHFLVPEYDEISLSGFDKAMIKYQELEKKYK